MPAYDYYTDDSVLDKDVLRNAGFTVLNNVMYVGNGHDDMLKYDGNLVYKPGLPQFDKALINTIEDGESGDNTQYYISGTGF